MCMRVELNHTKNGLPSLFDCRMNFTAAASNSESMVSIRFFVSGPVFSIFWPPSGRAQLCRTPRGAYFALNAGSFG